ncbi:MAG: DUF692 domain-containing protein [Ketobacter sp.]|nr:MAG: DUF692 domain-containing protein [Ketobacter sp.]
MLKRSRTMSHFNASMVGVGLRHPHYEMALDGASSIDFVEVHAENFFAAGGLTCTLLEEIGNRYRLSLHATGLGLGSAVGVDDQHLQRLQHLVDRSDPLLVSDHAALARSHFEQRPVHAGDLLPVEFSVQALAVLVENVDRVQQHLGRRLLVENIAQYIALQPADLSETAFLVSLVEQTQCGLLLDLNNLLVNAHNQGRSDPLQYAKAWLRDIPAQAVGELHLAGSTPVGDADIQVDDHAQPVSQTCWDLYRYALTRFGPVPTLVEWDNQLPSWSVLLQQAEQARAILNESTSGLKESATGEVNGDDL